MKKVLFILAVGILLFAGCGSPDEPGGGPGSGPGDGTTHQVGDKATINADSETFTMVYANDSTSMEFPTGENDNGEETLERRFWIAETETTNAVVAAVLQWAKDNGMFDTEDSSAHNYLNENDANTVKYGNQELVDLDNSYCRISYDKTTSQFTVDNGYTDHPVVEISWYGAVIICNWLTEIRDGNTDNLVYAGIDTDWDDDETVEDRTKTGFRLPGEWEWEYAGRYRGNDSVNTVDKKDGSGNLLYTNPYFTKGNSASGATEAAGNNDTTRAVAVFYYSSPTPTEAAVVKSLVNGTNTLGLYDMSGNVWEWCFNKIGTNRVICGGCWSSYAGPLHLGNRSNYLPSNTYSGIGFRLCRTAD